jgi:RNA polymerase sigma factor (sigma-70 family)
MSNTEERKILNGIATGNEAIITEFYKKYMPYIGRYIYQNSGNEEDVQDVFQDAIVLIYQKLKNGPLELNSSFKTYFYGVCKNIWRNRLRKNKKIIMTDNIHDDPKISNPSVIEDIENKEREHVYRKHFLSLHESCREVLNLLFQGKSMKEIAHITGYAEGYARRKKFDCKQYLIKMIENDPMYKEIQLNPEKE